MRIGLIGAGNMARALARGFGAPVLVCDPDAARAEALVEEVGGEALASNADVAARSDLIVLCHKPAQLERVAEQTGGEAAAVASVLWGVTIDDLERAYPGAPVYRFMPNIPVEVGRGLFAYVAGTHAATGPERDVLELFGRAGAVIPLDEAMMDPAGAVMSCGPAFFALVAEALAEAGASHGLDPDAARRMAVETMAGTAAVLRARDMDTAGLRERVASPGGVTARGLDVLEDSVRGAFGSAVDAVLGRGGR